MVICFKEKDRAVIEAKGLKIIEFKRILYRAQKNFGYAWTVLKEIADRFIKAWNVLKDKFLEVVDNVKMAIEVVRDIYHYRTSFRYRDVKFLSKCTGIEMQIFWKMTRHTWLARSCF